LYSFTIPMENLTILYTVNGCYQDNIVWVLEISSLIVALFPTL